jgi:L-histidine N-alpha-methyltransferase
MARRCWRHGRAPVLVDLGAGNCAKAARLFGPLAPRRYVAVDISVDYLRQALATCSAPPGADLVGLGLDFSHPAGPAAALVDGPALVFYPGSSIGNFAPRGLRLLREARAAARPRAARC